MSYAGASYTGPCEGRQAAPSNPTDAPRKGALGLLTSTVVLRCADAEKLDLQASAKFDGVTVSELLRETLGQIKSHRRKPVPPVNPALVRAVSRYGGNLNQIARRMNSAAMRDQVRSLDALSILTELVVIERQLSDLVATTADNDLSSC